MKIACVGEAMVELSLEASGETARVGFAGDTLNTAIYLKRAAPDLDVSYVTRLGRDAFSNRMLDFIRAEEISTHAVSVSGTRRPGLYAITTDAEGERSFTYWRENSAARDLFQDGGSMSFDVLSGFDVVYFSAISLAILPQPVRSQFLEWLAAYRQRGGRVGFDSNYRPALWEDAVTSRDMIGKAWALTDIALPSVDDEMAAFGDRDTNAVLSRLRGCGVTLGALKCGAGGPVSLGEQVAQAYDPATKVIDTTAAGDSFNAGYLAALLTGDSQAKALMAGHQLASRVIGIKGAIAPRHV